ncbi:MAG: Gfo/Idh/MocA family oxidoreductase [Bryobacteraceae bacterium]
MNPLRVAVIGVGSFGRNHARVISSLPDVELSAVVDADDVRGRAVAEEYGTAFFFDLNAAIGKIDAAVVATPTATHEEIASNLLKAGVDVLVEKPIAASSAAGNRLASLAESKNRILQVGHLERFNPAVLALQQKITIPLFFEIHRLSVFSPRSLDVDVVLDLMIHDLDIVLSITGQQPSEIHAAGISVLSPKVDIANVRLVFSTGCIANLTASRVSTEQVRKLRLFQPGEYISVDYHRQDANRLSVTQPTGLEPSVPANSSAPKIGFESLAVEKSEPLKLELEAFFHSVRTRSRPRVGGVEGSHALRVAESILGKIKEHSELVAETIRRAKQPRPLQERHQEY